MNAVTDKLPITVVILTRNEEAVVAAAINSAINDFSEVIVLDSYSTDNTTDVATAAGAVLIRNEFRGYASQRNFALKQMQKKNKWVFFLDADEMLSFELVAELRQVFSSFASGGYGLVLVRRKDFFFGRWIRRSSGYPTWFGRLCHSDRAWITREINEEYKCNGPVVRLQQHILHFSFAKGISHWIDKHNRYSTLEAQILGEQRFPGLRAFFSPDPTLRRKAHKSVFMAMPFRPFIAFFVLYIIKGGFLDGRPGFRYALLRMFYEYLIDLKVAEAKMKEESGQRP